MAETETAPVMEEKKKIKLPPLPPQVVNRNKIDCTLKTFQIVKGANEGKQYLGPEFTVENYPIMVEWLGITNVVSVLQTWAKRTAWSIWDDNVQDDGSFNMLGFIKGMEDLTEAGMKLADIRRELTELQAKQGLLIRDGDLGDENVLKEVKKLNEQILGYKDMEEKRSRKGKTETAEEPAVVTS